MITTPPLLDPRLQERYRQLVMDHLSPADQIAAGLRGLPDVASAMAHTQAAYRFWCNESVTLTQLVQPLLLAARESIPGACRDYALVIHDWSRLPYNTHTRKADRVPLSMTKDRGYDLQSALLVSDQGDPLAPVYLGLRAADGVHHTAADAIEPAPSQLDGLAPVMQRIEDLGWTKPVVHIIDREADSVGHFRDWSQAGFQFLVRADAEPKVMHNGSKKRLSAVADELKQKQRFCATREVIYHGRKAMQWVAQTEVMLTRPARPQRADGKRVSVPGPPLPLRLVVAEVRDEQGEVLAVWLLLSNLPPQVDAATIALWYYWRWRIESFFKLLKSAGQHVEEWQQETAGAIARRMLVVAMASVVVWRLQRQTTPAAGQLRKLLIRLSGRQMKHGVESTGPALLAGMWILLAMLKVLEHTSVAEIRHLAHEAGLLDLEQARSP